MAKKYDIGSKKFSELLVPLKYKPNKGIIKRMDSNMFSLDQNKVFNNKPEQLAFAEFSRCLSLFENRNPGLSPSDGMLRISGVQQLIIKEEQAYKEQLQQLAISTIREIYQVPKYVDLKAFIQPRLNLDTEQDHSPEPFLDLTLEQKNSMLSEIRKRECLNSLAHGSSMVVWTGVYHLVAKELDKINPSLKELYDYYTSTLGIGIWMMNPEAFQNTIENGSQITQGFNKLKFNKQKGFGGEVEARGINFPVLLHEINKGVIDWLISAGIPQSYSADELRYYYSKADRYEHELYHYLLSPSLWTELLDAAQIENENIPKLISKLTKQSYQELVELFLLIQNDKEQATEKIKRWKLE